MLGKCCDVPCHKILWMKKASLYLMSVFYLASGVNHFWHPEFYLQIMPSWMPWHKLSVMISGGFEMLFAILLLFPVSSRFAAWCIIIMLIAFFPLHVQMAINYFNNSNPDLWITIARLPLQLILIWWAYSFARNQVTDRLD